MSDLVTRTAVVDGLPPCYAHAPDYTCDLPARWWVATTRRSSGLTGTTLLCLYHRQEAISWARLDDDVTYVYGPLGKHLPPKPRKKSR